MRSRKHLAAILLVWSALAVPSMLRPPAQAATDPKLRVLAVQATEDRVSLIFELRQRPPRSLPAGAVSVTSGGTRLPVRHSGILSEQASLGFVIDASADAAASLRDGGRAGVASFLLQLPPAARTAVIADRRPPTVAAPPSVGVLDDLQATGALRSGGSRATSEALTLALRQVRSGPGVAPAIVLYTNAPNAGGESAVSLGARLRQANAVLAVITTSPQPQYWRDVAASTGGFAIAAAPEAAITSFDAVADGLRSRYRVTFPRPTSAGPVELRVGTGATALTAAVTVPDAPVAVETSNATPPARVAEQAPSRWFWLPGAGLLVVTVAAGLVLRRRRKRRRLARSQVALPGVRIFDVADPAGPREITNQLFESRMDRDARSQRSDDAPDSRGD